MKRRKIKGLIAALLALSLVTALFAGCSSSDTSDEDAEETTEAEDTEDTEDTEGAEENSEEEQELRTIRVAVMTTLPDQYAIEVGTDLGIFEEYNLQVEVTEYAYGINTIDAVVNGTADTGNLADYAAANRFGNTLEDTNLVIFSELTGTATNTGGLYVAAEYADNLEALDGSEGFITTTGTVNDYYVSLAINYLGLEEDNQTIINVDSTQTALSLVQQNTASAYVTSGSNATYVEEYGWVLVATSEELGVETGSYLLTTDEYLEENADLLADYLLALQESLDYITENLDEVSVEMEETFGVNADDFIETWNTYVFMLGLSVEGADHLQELADWAYEHEKFDTAYDVRQFYNAAAAEIAFPDNCTYE